MLRMLQLGLACLTLLVAAEQSAQATVITFGTTGIDRLDLAGPQSENGFIYRAVIGQGWEVQSLIGKQPASLSTFFSRQVSMVGDTVEFLLNNNGRFTLDSLDFSTVASEQNSSDDVLFSGFLDGNLVNSLLLSFETASQNAFKTVSSGFSGEIDRLTLRVVNATNNAALVDNLVLSASDPIAVPEPHSLIVWGLGGGILLAGAVLRRRRSIAD